MDIRLGFWFVIFFLNIKNSFQSKYVLRQKRENHQPFDLEDMKIRHVSEALANPMHLKSVVQEILIPRVVGTEGHDKVRDYIVDLMQTLGWDIQIDKFEDETPKLGTLTFENIITYLNPNAERYLLLACHYDSKYFKDQEFVGAIDSAIPCAMLLNLAETLKKHIAKHKNNTELSLMFVFFDGEEAFEEWGPKDSIYGARHLADKWEQEDFLHRIDLFMLLDLIGAEDPQFYNYFENTGRWFERLSKAEEKLSRRNLLKNYSRGILSGGPTIYFENKSFRVRIEDDHIPFMDKEVPILHLIPVPFPDVWHTPADDHSIIDYVTVENINKILRIFVIEYLHLFKTR